MQKLKITAKVPDSNLSAEIEIDFPEGITEMSTVYGEDVTYNLAKQQAVVRAQAVVRDRLSKGMPAAEIEKAMAAWKPGERVTGGSVDPVQAIGAKIAGATAEDKAKYLADLQNLLASLQS